MPKFSELELNLFIETTCSGCYQPDEANKRILGVGEGCPILKRARRGQMSSAWKRRRRAGLGETFECTLYTPNPPVSRRGRAPADTESMFGEEEVAAADKTLVPVDGWPDYAARARKLMDGEHQ